MGIRTKFLIILVLFSVIPLLCFYLVNQRLFTKLGDDIFEIATVLLLQTTAKELQSTADNYARNLDRELNQIAKEADAIRVNIKDLVIESSPLSPEDNLFSEILSQKLPHYFKRLAGFRSEIVSITFVANNGISYTHPTDKNSGFDRVRRGEKIAQQEERSDDIFWEIPSNDPAKISNLQNVVVGFPVRNPAASIVGHVLIDIDPMKLLEFIRPSSLWAQYEETMLLNIDSFLQSPGNDPLIIGVRKPGASTLEWKATHEPLAIEAVHKSKTRNLFAGKQFGEAGYFSLPYRGEQSLWAYSDTRNGLGILTILPVREVLYKIGRHPGRLSRWLTLDSLLIVSLVVVVMVIIVAYRSRKMVEPLFTIISAFKRVAAGDFSTKITFNNKDERQLIATAFNNMTLQLEDGFRMRQGLEVAKEVQQHFFPEIDPTPSAFDIAIRMKYCEETGGDHVDALKGENGKICIVVGDVTGHGIGAALHVATLRALVRSSYEVDSDLASVVTSVNSKLTKDMGDSGRFVTLFMAEIDPRTMELKWVRAGHDPGWLFTNHGEKIVSLGGPGIILGVDGDFSFSENTCAGLESGDILAVGTDGIWEASDPAGNQFGKDRVEQTLSRMSDKTASAICDSLLTELDQFRQGQNQEDDVSIVIIKVQ